MTAVARAATPPAARAAAGCPEARAVSRRDAVATEGKRRDAAGAQGPPPPRGAAAIQVGAALLARAAAARVAVAEAETRAREDPPEGAAAAEVVRGVQRGEAEARSAGRARSAPRAL